VSGWLKVSKTWIIFQFYTNNENSEYLLNIFTQKYSMCKIEYLSRRKTRQCLSFKKRDFLVCEIYMSNPQQNVKLWTRTSGKHVLFCDMIRVISFLFLKGFRIQQKHSRWSQKRPIHTQKRSLQIQKEPYHKEKRSIYARKRAAFPGQRCDATDEFFSWQSYI